MAYGVVDGRREIRGGGVRKVRYRNGDLIKREQWKIGRRSSSSAIKKQKRTKICWGAKAERLSEKRKKKQQKSTGQGGKQW